MADQTNAEVSDERLREAWPLCGYAPGNYSCRCHTCDKQFVGDKRAVTCLECAVIETKVALNRRSATSQASEGEDLWPNGLPEPTIDMLDLARNLPGMPSWVRAFARATAKDGSDAQRLEGIARALEVLSASPPNGSRGWRGH